MVEEILPGFSRDFLEMKEILSAKPAKKPIKPEVFIRRYLAIERAVTSEP
jgi:hypothetical protein